MTNDEWEDFKKEVKPIKNQELLKNQLPKSNKKKT